MRLLLLSLEFKLGGGGLLYAKMDLSKGKVRLKAKKWRIKGRVTKQQRGPNSNVVTTASR